MKKIIFLLFICLVSFFIIVPFAQATDFNFSLTPKWNLISFPTFPANTLTVKNESVFQSLIQTGKSFEVWLWANKDNEPYTKWSDHWFAWAYNDPESNFSDINQAKSYFIKVNEPVSFSVSGVVNNFTFQSWLDSADLKAGWNMTGFTFESSAPVATALKSIEQQYTKVAYWDKTANEYKYFYNPSMGVPEYLNDFTQFEPGIGYWVKIKTSYTFTGPTSGALNAVSAYFTVTPNGAYTGIITPASTGSGAFTPASLIWTNDATAKTFTYKPTLYVGTHVISVSSNPAITNPYEIAYYVPAVASQLVMVAAPTGGVMNMASTNFTITPNGAYTGTITPKSTGDGSFSYDSLTWSGDAAPRTFTYTPTSITGSPHVISFTSSPAISNPSSISYTVMARSVTVISPNGGGTFRVGDRVNVSWSTQGMSPESIMDIFFVPGSGNGTSYVSLNTGDFSFVIPTNIPVPNQAQVQVKLRNVDIYDDSDYFSIQANN